MDNKVVIYGVVQGGTTPTVIPIDSFGLLPVDLNLQGVPVVGAANDANSADSATANKVPVISFSYIHDPNSATWLQLNGVSNNNATIAPNAGSANIPVLNFPMIYDPLANLFRRLVGGNNSGPSKAIDPEAKNIPVLSYNYMASTDPSIGTVVWQRLNSLSNANVNELNQSLLVAPQIDKATNDQPAVNTAAVASIADINGQRIKISGVGYSITAVAAIAAPLLIELREDSAGSNALLWSTQELVPAGQAKTIFIPLNITANIDAVLTVAAPGATNFVTAYLQYNDTLSTAPP